MKNAVFLMVTFLIGTSTFASTSYQCGGKDSDLEVTVNSPSSIFVTVTEWSADYKAESRDENSASVKYKHQGEEDELAATEVSISRSLVDGEKTGYAVLVGGESGGKYPCRAE